MKQLWFWKYLEAELRENTDGLEVGEKKNNDLENDTKTSGQNCKCRTEMPLIKVSSYLLEKEKMWE